jgi:hypothetical protein
MNAVLIATAIFTAMIALMAEVASWALVAVFLTFCGIMFAILFVASFLVEIFRWFRKIFFLKTVHPGKGVL